MDSYPYSFGRMEDQQGESEYSRLLKKISEIEGSTKRQEAGIADISGSFGAGSKKSSITYQALLNTILESERRGGAFRRPGQAPGRPQPMQPQAAQPELIVQPEVRPIEQAPIQQPEQLAMMQQPQLEQKESSKVYAGKELKELTKLLPVHVPEFGEHKLKRTVTTELVLPNLSLADQVAELERILEGLTSGSLATTDVSTISEEVYGLLKKVNAEKQELQKKKKQLEGDEFQLWKLRDQRIKEVITQLEMAKKRR